MKWEGFSDRKSIVFLGAFAYDYLNFLLQMQYKGIPYSQEAYQNEKQLHV